MHYGPIIEEWKDYLYNDKVLISKLLVGQLLYNVSDRSLMITTGTLFHKKK